MSRRQPRRAVIPKTGKEGTIAMDNTSGIMVSPRNAPTVTVPVWSAGDTQCRSCGGPLSPNQTEARQHVRAHYQ